MNDYYVYIYYRLDTNEPFYVGKGHDDRWRCLNRTHNLYFKNIINKHPIAVEIIKDNLTEEQAFGIECWLINELVFEYGFSIEIKNNRSIEKGYHLCNMTWGGDGVSRPCKEETKERISKSRVERGVAKGENNPFYGRKFSESMSEETFENWRKKQSEINSGIGNPMYGKHGKDNPNSKSVICLTTKKIFYSTKEAGLFYKHYGCDSSRIAKCCKKYVDKEGYIVKSAGKLPDGTKLVWRYLVWKHNKKYRIIVSNK